ncbi:hypothetical protein ACQPXM_37050 [Kribbella sp. CA-253562]|uniref:hypothetical protein n=1 Tax=Kribbella sp. CA-253562 TaxID=3239942 RepID=UPI003D8F325A
MTITWLQLTCGRGTDSKSASTFTGKAEDRAWTALQRLHAKLLPQYDGAAWLAQGGFERVSIDVQYRVTKGRQRRTVALIGRLVNVDVSVACPELPDLTVEQLEDVFRPVVLDALAALAEAQGLGPLPPAGQGGGLSAVPLRALIDDPDPYDEEPGDCFVITRVAPDGVNPEVIERYERDLAWLLSGAAQAEVIEAEVSGTAVRWTVRVGR